MTQCTPNDTSTNNNTIIVILFHFVCDLLEYQGFFDQMFAVEITFIAAADDDDCPIAGRGFLAHKFPLIPVRDADVDLWPDKSRCPHFLRYP